MPHIRSMSPGQRSRSQSALTICAFMNCVQPVTTSYTVGFQDYLAEMITTKRCVAYKNLQLGQRSRSQPALKVCAFQIHVRPIISSCMVGWAEMIITIRRYVACKNHAARSKVKVTAGTLSLCIPESCQSQKVLHLKNRWDIKFIWQK